MEQLDLELHNKRQKLKWNNVRITGIGFLILILLGSLLLWLPISNRQPIAYLDALFTAVSAVCVTGLLTVTPAVQFTLFGKIVLLLLIQMGGLGIIALSTMFFIALRMQISVKERRALLDTYGMGDMGGIVKIVKGIVKGTLIAEGIGAVCYCFEFIPRFGVIKGIWYSVFTAVSAFCNAGIDILGDSSLMNYVTNPLVNITTMLLIVTGGLGFSVWFDMKNVFKKRDHRGNLHLGWFRKLSLHSELVLVITGALIFGGGLVIFLLEYNNPETIGDLSLGQKIMAALFQSVTDRTAGFASFSQAGMHNQTKLFNCLLMFIGGSPSGTAGGTKTTTVALLFMTTFSTINGGNELEAFGRRISGKLIRTALAIVMISATVLLLGAVVILGLEPDGMNAIDVFFEATSAIFTVGLSANLTASLCRGSQAVLMILMYIGRLGPMTMALMFMGKPNRRDRIRKLPEENIMIG